MLGWDATKGNCSNRIHRGLPRSSPSGRGVMLSRHSSSEAPPSSLLCKATLSQTSSICRRECTYVPCSSVTTLFNTFPCSGSVRPSAYPQMDTQTCKSLSPRGGTIVIYILASAAAATCSYSVLLYTTNKQIPLENNTVHVLWFTTMDLSTPISATYAPGKEGAGEGGDKHKYLTRGQPSLALLEGGPE